MNHFIELIDGFLSLFILIYALFVMLSYTFLAAISYNTLKSYLKNNRKVNYNKVIDSNLSPSISIIAPAYNEENTIIDNIKSILSVRYPNFEVIIVNDGSKDGTLAKIIKEFQLVPYNYAYRTEIKTQIIRKIYRSNLPEFEKLIVVDKENGGKADALNAGINVASSKYITSIDVDCILEEDALIKMIKPFLQTNKKVIATGGVIRIANSCEVTDGKITKVNVPKSLLARVQVVEYLRAFLLGRMAWSRMDGLLLISGAFGMFDREIVIKCGAYSTKTVGEDMELLVRMRRYMIDNNLEYEVQFIPDPLCWTEVPEDLNILTRQRNRWTRGTIETLIIHRKMFFNPKYKILGMVSFPYWFTFEFLAPLIEFFGFIFLLLMTVFGIVDWQFFIALFVMIYSFAFMFNMFSLFVEEKTFAQYKKFHQLYKLAFTALLEPFLFHPVVVYAAVKGNLSYLSGSKSWGEMSRKGFDRSNL